MMSLTMTASRNRVTGMTFHEILGEVIREQRQAKGLSLRDVSRNGFVSIGHLSDVERGYKEASSAFLEAVANGLGVELYELIIETGYRLSELKVPDTPESLFARQADWENQYADLGK